MMQCKTKSENLAHILGYQIWAVTPCPLGAASTPLDAYKITKTLKRWGRRLFFRNSTQSRRLLET